MVKNYSRRDQLSFMYSIWKNKYKRINIVDILWNDNKYYKVIDHKETKEKTIKKLEQELREKNELIQNQINEINNIKKELNLIINSKSWIFITKIRNLCKKIGRGK